MSNALQVCLYNADGKSSAKLCRHIKSLSLVRFVSEVTNEEELANVLDQTPIHLIFFHLDPKPGLRHRFEAVGEVELLEVSTPELDDVVRLEDRYGRAGS